MPKVEDNDNNVKTCMKYCGPCLTYPGVEGEALFCARGKSSAPRSKKGCNCSICEVQKTSGCNDVYYCINGACR